MTSPTSYLARFNYQLSGPPEGRKWVFLHGLMGYGANWRKIASQMPGEHILVFDQRGHGRSWKPETGYASDDYADDLYLIAQELGWDRFILVGHSMGGRNALSFAARYPEKVEKLIIEDIGPDGNMEAVKYYQDLLAAVPTPFANKLQAKEFFLNDWTRVGVQHENLLVLGQYLYSNLEDKPDGSVDWRFSKSAVLSSVIQGRAKDVWHELRSLTMPTLVIRGQHSKELSKEVLLRMEAANPRLRVLEISDAGHWVHADQPRAFTEAVLQFADS